jgi:hypothetical protein
MSHPESTHGERPSFTQGVARRVLDACKREDSEARITYVGVDESGRTRVRVQSSTESTVESLQRSLRKAMPFAIVRASEDVLDGTLQAELIVPTADDEFSMAYEQQKQALATRLLSGGATMMAAAGASLLLASFWATLSSQKQ